MKYQKFELFPTHVIKFDLSEVITQDDVTAMITDIDAIIVHDNLMQVGELTPKHQSKPILFLPDAPAVWQKLKQTFLMCCDTYLKHVPNFVNNQDTMEFTGSRAWFYKGWKSLNVGQSNPWHGHTPSFLSGIFYLRIPKAEGGGTSFMDPRLNEAKQTINVVIEPTELTWVIFPGSMYHQSQQSNSEEPRYVIAADSYVKVI